VAEEKIWTKEELLKLGEKVDPFIEDDDPLDDEILEIQKNVKLKPKKEDNSKII
jgi:hypothetical protein